MSKLTSISKTRSGKVDFYFDDGVVYHYEIIKGCDGAVFLNHINNENDEVFSKLGITSPRSLYEGLGIFIGNGICPYCKREDLKVLFRYLLENYGKEGEDKEKKGKKAAKQPSEWDWLLG